MIDETERALEELTARLRRYPRHRYPIQHATTQFHLGVALTNAGRTNEARQALSDAIGLFDPEKLPVEHAKSLNALGAALRAGGELQEARSAFAEAARLFREAEQPLEEGAALYNLALVDADANDLERRIATLERARELLDPRRASAQAAAAAYEHGTALLAHGRIGKAINALADAVALAGRSGQHATLGAAENALGLAYLAENRPEEAVRRFKSAVGGHPRSLRPEGFAMAKANLAVAYAHMDDRSRARLAAKQALSVAEASAAVKDQAGEVLDGCGQGWGDLIATLDGDPPEARPALMREELVRWVASDRRERDAECAAWIEAQLARPDGVELAHLWLGALLELPPPDMETLVRSLQRALKRRSPAEVEGFRSDMSRAMIRFHVPQWERLKDTFNRIALELGDLPSWE